LPELLLVKHSLPEIVPGVPAREWHLSEVGRLRCEALAEMLAERGPSVLVSSIEPKASETAQIVAGRLGVPWETREGLHEHLRESVPFLPSQEFEERVREFFRKPRKLTYGEETAEEAHRRFAEAIEGILVAYPGESVAVVAHGTVISLFVAGIAGLEPFSLWKRLGLPSFVVLSRPDMKVGGIVENAGEKSTRSE
jgi:broad specificity phosphatase PhoE